MHFFDSSPDRQTKYGAATIRPLRESVSGTYNARMQDQWNLYGAQTLYMNVESDGNANGVFLLNSNAMGKSSCYWQI